MPMFFILCPAYHGATLLSILLNNHRDIVALGDTNPSRRHDPRCACGRMVSVCPFWTGLYRSLNLERFEGLDKFLPRLPVLSGRYRVDRLLAMLLAEASLRLGRSVWRLGGRGVRDFHEVYRSFIGEALAMQGKSLFVDGEKSTIKALVLHGLGEDVRIIHLTRDVRGFTNSLARNQKADPAAAPRIWQQAHGAILHVTHRLPAAHSLQLRYEELVAEPEATMKRLFAFLGVAETEIRFTPQDRDGFHLVGNRMVHAFDGTIRADVSWRTELSSAAARQAVRQSRAIFDRLGYVEDHSPG